MKHFYYTLSFALFAVFFGHAQTIITQWDFNNITPGDILTASPSTGTGTLALTGGATTPTTGSSGTGSSDVSTTNVAFQTTTYPAQSTANQSAGIAFNTSTVGYQNIQMRFDLRLSNTASRWVQIQYTTDASNWQNMGDPIRMGGMGDDNAGDTWHNQNLVDFSGISAVNNNPNFGVRIVTSFSPIAFTMVNTAVSYLANEAYEPARNPSTGSNSNYGGGTMRYDMLTIEGTSTAPTIVANPTVISGLNQVLPAPSAEQTFEVSGANLSADIILGAPANFEISLTSGAAFASSLNLTPNVDGEVATTTVYVRLNAATEDTYTGDISLNSTGAAPVLVSLSGVSSAAILPEISVNPTSLSGFTQVIGQVSDEQTLTVSGSNLTDDININAPTGFEISLTTGVDFSNTLVLPQVGGAVAETPVYVRLNHNVAGTIVDDIILSTTGIADVLVPISGSVEAPVDPTLGLSPEQLNAFLQNLGFPSATQTVTVGGSNLNSDITITTNGSFFISTDAAGAFSQSITLIMDVDYVDPTPIYVHLNANAAGTYSGTMTISTDDVAVVEIDLEGETVQPEATLVYYWHFNTLITPEDVTSIDADYSLVPGITGKFDYTNPVEGQRDMDAYSTGSLLNAQQGEGAGTAVRVRNPSVDRTLDFFVPTNNASGIKFNYAVHRSGSGMLENIFSYSIDGINYITDGLDNNVVEVTESYELKTINFSSIAAANNNPNFRIRITFNGNNIAVNGNNRIDNITLTADSYLGLDSENTPVVVVYPNPAKDVIHVATTDEIQQLTIMDLHGRVIMNGNSNTLNIDCLQAGLYILWIETAHGATRKHFVKK